MSAQLLIRCSCGLEFAVDVRGRDVFEIRDEAIAKGWHFNAKDWRCSDCYSRWAGQAGMRVARRADARKEAAHA